jgi:hypothetical protein
MGSNLYELIQAATLRVYSAPELRSAVLQAVAREINGSNWKITKSRRASRVDLVVALAMSALGAVRDGQNIGEGASIIGSANLGPRRGPSVSLLDFTDRPNFDDDAEYLAASRREQAQWVREAQREEFGASDGPDPVGVYGSAGLRRRSIFEDF